MSGYRCPACGMDNIIATSDLERDLAILKCRICGEMFAVSNVDVCEHSEGWVFNEWANSFASQKRLCGKVVKR